MKNTRLRLSRIRRVWDGPWFFLCGQVPWGVGDPIRCTHRPAGNWATVYVAEFLIVLRTEDVSFQVMWNSAIRWWKSCYENLPLWHGTCWARCLYGGGFRLEVAIGCRASAIIYKNTRVYGNYQLIIAINASPQLTLQPIATSNIYIHCYKHEISKYQLR